MRPSAISSTFCAALALAPVALSAQQTESTATPVGMADGTDVVIMTHSRRYAIPDLPPLKPPSADKQAKFFTIRPSVALLGDWTNFAQDDANIRQVGVLDDVFQVRSARLTLLGSIGRSYKIGFQVGGEYKGFDTDPEQNWQLTDLALTFPIGARTKMTLGKTKETFSYEMVGDAANLPQSERVLNAFFVSRNMGMRMTHVLGANKRATLSYGVYNDSLDINSQTSRGWDLSARATGLIWDEQDNKHYLHLGLSWRHVASNGQLRYRSRPETNVGANFVDTGDIAADGAEHFGLEALLSLGAVSFLSEAVTARVDAPTRGNPRFNAWYITGSWVLTGESRPYDRNVGYARRVIPTGYWGAPELVARVARVDLDDGGVSGGHYFKTYAGLNWWATTRWKYGLGWSHTWLDRNGEEGEADSLLARIQWVY
jgi:phosphate-selective porin OprO/OprP